jgi:hypothetical protein
LGRLGFWWVVGGGIASGEEREAGRGRLGVLLKPWIAVKVVGDSMK